MVVQPRWTTIFILLTTTHHTVGQYVNSFFWSFPNQDNTNGAFTQCGTISPVVSTNGSSSFTGDPPFYMYTVPQGGIPAVQAIGSSPNSLSYTCDYAEGTQFTLAIYDSRGNGGGWIPLYTVASGSSSSCLPSSPSSPPSFSLNTTSISPCSNLGISISGGSPPYTVNILPFGGTAGTLNLTLSSSQKYLNFVANVQSPNTLVVTVRDSKGSWAPTSSKISVSGSGDGSNCAADTTGYDSPPGGVGGSGTSTVKATTTSTKSSTKSSSKSATQSSSSGAVVGGDKKSSSSNTGAIVGGVVGGIVAAVIALLLLWWYARKRRRNDVPASSKVENERRHGGVLSSGFAAMPWATGKKGKRVGDEKEYKDLEKGKEGLVQDGKDGDGPEREDSGGFIGQPVDSKINPFTEGLGGSVPPSQSQSPTNEPQELEEGVAGATRRPDTGNSQGTGKFVVTNPDDREEEATEEGGGREELGENSTQHNNDNNNNSTTPLAVPSHSKQSEVEAERISNSNTPQRPSANLQGAESTPTQPSTPLAERQARILQHQDAGRISSDGHGYDEEIPPAYNSLVQRERSRRGGVGN